MDWTEFKWHKAPEKEVAHLREHHPNRHYIAGFGTVNEYGVFVRAHDKKCRYACGRVFIGSFPEYTKLSEQDKALFLMYVKARFDLD